ncbi:DUF4430 domain-containing protein [Ornithinibacillus halotolerans]|uniref:DUF4430 domain-containing protein n=1 Tax=Ornithinibacillus halotolerans TaxID=1274357 RepID=A0A916SDT1_9BACI|nr:DUF4430 domain-containing protein [Ornithinibacillus halotolerans]GGA92522.1 hypothetical protein GCM10008025_38690 [Ornithinibacillus halotolerans]
MRKSIKLVNYFLIILMVLAPFFTLGTTVTAAQSQTITAESEKNHTIEHSITISEETNEIPLPLVDVEIEEGDTVIDALIKATEEYEIPLSYIGEESSVYVEGIDDVYEFDRGPGSGWMYRVNGIFPNRGAGVIKLVPGDRVEWLYTTNLGQDIGADLKPFRDNLDPTILVNGMTDGETVNEKHLTFSVHATSYFGTTLVPTVTVNDVEITPSEESSYTSTLQEGTNTISIDTEDKEGRQTTQTYTIQYEKVEEKPTPGENEETEFNYEQLTTAIEKASSFILEKGVYSEWEAIGLAKAGKVVPNDYLTVFHENVQSQIIQALENGRIKITDIERIAIAAVAVGLDPRDLNGLNLIELIYNSPERRGGFDTMTFQGNNGPIFALIALDTKNFPVPEDAKWTRQGLIDELLRTQNEDGSWSLNEMFATPSVDITGMALIGLSPYKDQPAVRDALDRAVDWLSSVQSDNGGFDGGDFIGGITSEATSQVIIGLTAYGIDPTAEIFTKNGHNLITHLLEFQNPDGGFKHTHDYDYSDPMATEQALQAIVAYDSFLNGKGSIYHFGQLNEEVPGEDEDEEEENGNEQEDAGNDEESGAHTDDQEKEENAEDKKDDQEETENPGENDEKGTVSKEDNEDSLKDDKKEQVTTTDVTKGKKLPNTSANFYNFILIGMTIMFIGGLLLVLHFRKQRKQVS